MLPLGLCVRSSPPALLPLGEGKDDMVVLGEGAGEPSTSMRAGRGMSYPG